MTAGLDILAKGFVVGLAVAAPVGPISLLCIRKTLADGRFAGLATGFGAATADAVYGAIAAAGLALTGLLLSHAVLMKTGGGLLLALLGLMTLRKALAVVGDTVSADVKAGGIVRAYTSTFVLTIANPMTILAFIAMISALGAGNPYLLVLGVFAGSAAWWLGLVHAALFVRGRITPPVMRAIDLLSGLILFAWGGWLVIEAVRGGAPM